MAVGGAWQDAGLNSNKIRISHPGFDPKVRYQNYSLHPQIRVGYKFQRSSESKGGQIVIARFTLWATVPHCVRAYTLFLLTAGVLIANDSSFAADKLRVAYVSPSLALSLPWVAKEAGMLAKHELAAEILLVTGSPRLVQSLIAGDVDRVFGEIRRAE